MECLLINYVLTVRNTFLIPLHIIVFQLIYRKKTLIPPKFLLEFTTQNLMLNENKTLLLFNFLKENVPQRVLFS